MVLTCTHMRSCSVVLSIWTNVLAGIDTEVGAPWDFPPTDRAPPPPPPPRNFNIYIIIMLITNAFKAIL